MTVRNRKFVIDQAKKEITSDLYEKLQTLMKERSDLLASLGENCHESEELSEANQKVYEAQSQISDWEASKKKKKKKAIQWSEGAEKRSSRRKKHKKLNWDVAQEVTDAKQSNKKNNSSWLFTGSLVVHRMDRDKTMMVVDVDHKKGTARALKDGEVRAYRALSLRPAFCEE